MEARTVAASQLKIPNPQQIIGWHSSRKTRARRDRRRYDGGVSCLYWVTPPTLAPNVIYLHYSVSSARRAPHPQVNDFG